jgi:hypothetical protein
VNSRDRDRLFELERLRVGKEGIERCLVPDNSRIPKRAAIAEVVARPDPATDDADQRRPKFGTCRLRLVAGAQTS